MPGSLDEDAEKSWPGAKEDTTRGREGKHIQSSVEIMLQFRNPQSATVVKDLGGKSVLLLTGHMAPGASQLGSHLYKAIKCISPRKECNPVAGT